MSNLDSNAVTDVAGVAVTSASGDTTSPNGAPAQVPAGGTATPPGQPVASPEPAQQPDPVALADLQARLDRLEGRNAQRPASTIEQIQAQIDELSGVRKEAVDTKHAARTVADSADNKVAALESELRGMRLRDAATQAGVPSDRVPFVASAVAGMEGDPETVIKALLEAQPWLKAKTAPNTPDVAAAGPATTGEPGLDALARDIADRNRRR